MHRVCTEKKGTLTRRKKERKRRKKERKKKKGERTTTKKRRKINYKDCEYGNTRDAAMKTNGDFVGNTEHKKEATVASNYTCSH